MGPKPLKFTFSSRLPESNLLAIQGSRNDDVEAMLANVEQLLNVHEIIRDFFEPVSPRLAVDFQEVIENDIESSSYSSLELQVAVRLYLIEQNDRYVGVHDTIRRFHAAARAAINFRAQGNVNSQREAEVISLARTIHTYQTSSSRSMQPTQPATSEHGVSAPPTRRQSQRSIPQRGISERIAADNSQREDEQHTESRAIDQRSVSNSNNNASSQAETLQQVTELARSIQLPVADVDTTLSQAVAFALAGSIQVPSHSDDTPQPNAAQGSNVSETTFDNDRSKISMPPAKRIILRIPKRVATMVATDAEDKQAKDTTSNEEHKDSSKDRGDVTKDDARNKNDEKYDDDGSSSSDSEDGSGNNDGTRMKKKNTPGPKGYTWTALPGFNHTEAKKGKADPTQFVISLQGTHKKTLKKIIYSWSYQQSQIIKFDWSDPSHITKLNRWRSQVVRRRLNYKAHQYRESWTQIEADALMDILTETLRVNGNNYFNIDWEQVANRLNARFASRTIPAGSQIAVSTANPAKKGENASLTKGGKTLKDRLGSNRNGNACRNQADKLPAIKALLDAARAKNPRVKKANNGKASSKKGKKSDKKRSRSSEEDEGDEGDEEDDAAEGDVDYDELDKKKKRDEDDEDEDESPRGPSKRQRYVY